MIILPGIQSSLFISDDKYVNISGDPDTLTSFLFDTYEINEFVAIVAPKEKEIRLVDTGGLETDIFRDALKKAHLPFSMITTGNPKSIFK